MEKEVVGASTNKRLILVLNKIDLVAKDVVQKWLKYLRNELPTVAFKASTQQQNRNLHRSRVAVDRAGEDLLKGGGSVARTTSCASWAATAVTRGYGRPSPWEWWGSRMWARAV
ncbi:guanine nucleotide-binding protein-like 3-like protein [Rhinoraja longicauda]